MISSIRRCGNQILVAYLLYKQHTHQLFEAKCEDKKLKLAFVTGGALNARKADSAAENG
jgi:hypothetical protein